VRLSTITVGLAGNTRSTELEIQHVEYLDHNKNIDHDINASSLTDARVEAANPLALFRYDEGEYFNQGSVGEEVTHYTSNGPAAPKKLLDIDGLETTYGLKRWTIRLYCSQRKIPFVKIGRRVYFDPVAIDAWIQEHSRPVQEVHIPYMMSKASAPAGG
jgi:predicted DNA-binding transcriptional regulator AlpA